MLDARSMLVAQSMLFARGARELPLPLSISAIIVGLSTTETTST